MVALLLERRNRQVLVGSETFLFLGVVGCVSWSSIEDRLDAGETLPVVSDSSTVLARRLVLMPLSSATVCSVTGACSRGPAL